MHHKYVVRDGASVWTGSTNWTDDSWSREENVIAVVDSGAVAGRYAQNFEQLWRRQRVSRSGKVSSKRADGVRVWFCPKRGSRLAHRIAHSIATAERRVRIASPVITSAPILGSLAEAVADGKVDVAGVVDNTQVNEVLLQWAANPVQTWKAPAIAGDSRGHTVLREGVDAVRAGVGARLHAREGDRLRRHRLPRELQPLALRRVERGERARDRRRRPRGSARAVRRRGSGALPGSRAPGPGAIRAPARPVVRACTFARCLPRVWRSSRSSSPAAVATAAPGTVGRSRPLPPARRRPGTPGTDAGSGGMTHVP